MIRLVAAFAAVLALSGCSMFHAYPNMDIACMRNKMLYGANNGGSGLPFDHSMSACSHPESDDPLGMVNPRYRPLDLRADPELQRMAENPAINDWGYPYIKRDGTSSDGKPLHAPYVYRQ